MTGAVELMWSRDSGPKNKSRWMDHRCIKIAVLNLCLTFFTLGYFQEPSIIVVILIPIDWEDI